MAGTMSESWFWNHLKHENQPGDPVMDTLIMVCAACSSEPLWLRNYVAEKDVASFATEGALPALSFSPGISWQASGGRVFH